MAKNYYKNWIKFLSDDNSITSNERFCIFLYKNLLEYDEYKYLINYDEVVCKFPSFISINILLKWTDIVKKLCNIDNILNDNFKGCNCCCVAKYKQKFTNIVNILQEYYLDIKEKELTNIRNEFCNIVDNMNEQELEKELDLKTPYWREFDVIDGAWRPIININFGKNVDQDYCEEPPKKERKKKNI